MKRIMGSIRDRRERGQSLTEVSLFLPIFIILLAGLAEVGQIMVAQNEVSNSARSGARFMANGGGNDGMVSIVLDVVTQTLEQEASDWDVWAIRGRVNDQGDGFADWEFEHVFGISNTVRYSEVNESQVQAEVLTELQTDLDGSGPVIAAGLRIVGTYILHDLDSLLGLNAIPWLANINSVRGLSVMRIVGLNSEVTDGCDVFPIAIHKGIRSVTAPGVGSNPYPDESDFGAGSPTPEYYEFVNHTPDVPMADATQGDVYKIENGAGSGNFGWLRWNTGRPNNEGTLRASLTWPGNSADYTTDPGSGQPVGDYGRINGYVEPGDVTDTSLHIGDYVAANTGVINSAAIRGILNGHVRGGRWLRVVIWDEATGTGESTLYRTGEFAVFQLHGYKLSEGGGSSWILAEFIMWDSSCGQVISE